MKQNLTLDIAKFKARIESDGRDFCEELYRWSTIRLLAHKWAYYVHNRHYVEDLTYDREEYGWYVMGRALGLLSEDETSPCVDFDGKHVLATTAIAYAKTLKFK